MYNLIVVLIVWLKTNQLNYQMFGPTPNIEDFLHMCKAPVLKIRC